MAILKSMPNLSWNVTCKTTKQTWSYHYVFTEDKTVTWSYQYGVTGGSSGKWEISKNKILITWKSKKTETWNLPIDTTNWSGTCLMDSQTATLTATANNYSDFSGVKPVGQMDSMACWAACLSWISSAVKGNNGQINPLNQMEIVRDNSHNFNTYAGISGDSMMALNLTGMNLNKKRIDPDALKENLKAHTFPMFIGFASGPMGGHVNVIYAYDEEADLINVMEPWFPAPEKDHNYVASRLENALNSTQIDPTIRYNHKRTGADFVFTGRHLSRPLSYYRPLHGKFIILIPSSVSGG
jgi:Papain-like cysteine protease AvrRpt2